MTFDELAKEILKYAKFYNCSLADSINDWEFDGPDGGSGLSRNDEDRLEQHFISLGYDLLAKRF